MKKLTPLGHLGLIVVVGVVAGAVGNWILRPSQRSRALDKTIKWEALEGEEGSDLQRLETPQGWIVENVDGYMVVVDDAEHEWLKDE
jgi:hypothetical protein